VKEKPTPLEKKANKLHADWEFAYVHPRYNQAIEEIIEEQKAGLLIQQETK
jgi:hypothetical protein